MSEPSKSGDPREWILCDHPREYKNIEKLIEENKVQELEVFLMDLTRDNCYTLGPHSFSPNGFDPPPPGPPFDPRRSSQSLRLTMQSMLMIACQHPYQSPDIVSLLLSKRFRNHNSPNKCEWFYHQLHSWSCVAPLHVACTGYSQNLRLVKTLVKLGADVNLKTGCCGETPLHLALASYGTEEAVDIARYLVCRGAKVNAVDACGNTPLALLLHRGEKSKKEELAGVLLSRKLKVNILNNVGFGALHYASLTNEDWAVKKLLSKGASPLFNTSDDRKYKPTSPVFLTSSEKVARIFISRFSCPLPCKIDALLMVGASGIGRKEKLHKKLWQEAVCLRQAHGIFPSDMHNIGEQKEMRTMENFNESTKYSGGPSSVQVVLIQERCLGYVGDLGILKAISDLHPSFFYDEGVRTHYLKRMIHCLKNTAFPHWLMSIETHWKKELSYFSKDLDIATRVVCHPYKQQERSLEDSEPLEQFAGLCIDLLEALEYSYNHMLCTKGIGRTKDLDEFVWMLLNIFVSWYRVIYHLGLASDQSVLYPLKNSIQKLVDKNIQFLGTTLLHFFPSVFTKSRHTMDIYELILQSDGVEPYVNQVSREGDRPLHCVAKAKCERRVSRYTLYFDYDEEEEEDQRSATERMVSLIVSLMENGAHLDAVNGQGKTIWNCSNDLHQLLPPSPRPLACIAAQLIVDEIPYQELSSVPPRVKHFINLHNPNCCHNDSDTVAL